jgi:outer membrane protein insertion porin family
MAVWFFVCLLALVGCVNKASCQVPDSNTAFPLGRSFGVIIRSIEFVGNKHFSDERLHKRIGIELGERYDPFLAETGRRTIIDVYQKVGYAFVEVALDSDKAKEGRLVYKINEGPRVKIKRIKFIGNKTFSGSTLANLLKTKQSSWLIIPGYYSEQTLNEDLDALRGFYYKHGYLGYEVSVERQFSPDRTEVTVIFRISEGRPYQIREILVSGNRAFPDDQIKKMLRIGPGQVYKKDKVTLGVRSILDLHREKGFIDAEVAHLPRFSPDVNDNHVTLEIQINEGRQFRIGRIEISGSPR